MQLRTIVALATISLFAAIPLFTAAQASANSALDQYVEQVPKPVGNTDLEGNDSNRPPSESLDPAVAKDLKANGEDGRILAVIAAATTPTAAMTDPTSGVPGRAGHDGSSQLKESGNYDKGELDRLLVLNKPGTGESMVAAAGVSGVNGPLAIFVAAVALLMGAAAYRRHLRSRVR